MKRVLFMAAFLLPAGCGGGAGDVSESAIRNRAEMIERAANASVEGSIRALDTEGREVEDEGSGNNAATAAPAK